MVHAYGAAAFIRPSVGTVLAATACMDDVTTRAVTARFLSPRLLQMMHLGTRMTSKVRRAPGWIHHGPHRQTPWRQRASPTIGGRREYQQ